MFESELPIRRVEEPGMNPADEAENEELAILAKALGHPHRVAIIRYLKAHPVCICGQIVDILPVAQSTVSQHLKKLKEAGWITGDVEGPRSCYCLNGETLKRFLELVAKV
jgi:ArsR family transcriptional regulator, arsenate/arsenite/antimonite-responsive transcriptional repressor